MTMRKWLLTLLFKYHCKLYLNQRLFGTTIVTNKMNGYDNKPVLMNNTRNKIILKSHASF